MGAVISFYMDVEIELQKGEVICLKSKPKN